MWNNTQFFLIHLLVQNPIGLGLAALLSLKGLRGARTYRTLIYASLLSIPDELLEAAKVDGASPFRIFWRIKVPLILPTLGLVTILTFVGNFNTFELVYAVKGALAGPDFSTDIMGTFFYRTFFGYQSQLGSATMGATVATLMFLVILLGVMAYFYFIQRRLTRYQL